MHTSRLYLQIGYVHVIAEIRAISIVTFEWNCQPYVKQTVLEPSPSQSNEKVASADQAT